MTSPLAVLDRHLYTTNEAARLLHIPTPKLRRWLEGYARRGVFYKPVIRIEPTGSDEVTWGEFVEGGLLSEYRTNVPLQRLRPVIEELRQELGLPYPLAHFRPLVDERALELVFRAQELVDLDDELFLIRRVRGRDAGWQLQWAEPVLAFMRKAEFNPDGFVYRLHPQESAVVIDPNVEFGIPQVGGIRTETIAEAYATGESVNQIAEAWGLTADQVHAAIRWELSLAREVA